MVEVVDRRSIVVFFSVSEGLFGPMGIVRHMLLILVVGVVAFMSKRVIILAVETAMVEWAVVEVMSIVVLVVVVTVLGLTAAMVALEVTIVMDHVVIVVELMMLLVETLNVVIIDNALVMLIV